MLEQTLPASVVGRAVSGDFPGNARFALHEGGSILTEGGSPPVAADDAFGGPEDQELSVPAPGVLGNDSDPEGGALNALLVANPAHGYLMLNADGSFVYVPECDFNGTDSFTYKANDGTADSNVAVVSINVEPVRDVPYAYDDNYSTDEDTALNVPALGVLGNDGDPDGDVLSALLASGPAHGTLTLNTDGSFLYNPEADYNGADGFTYMASDGFPPAASMVVRWVVLGTAELAVDAVGPAAVARDYLLEIVTDGPVGLAEFRVSNDDGSTWFGWNGSAWSAGALRGRRTGVAVPLNDPNVSVTFSSTGTANVGDSWSFYIAPPISVVTIVVNAVDDPTETATATATPTWSATPTLTPTQSPTTSATFVSPTVTPTPSPTPAGGILVSGQLLYYSNHAPVAGVEVTGSTPLGGPPLVMVQTDATGSYLMYLSGEPIQFSVSPWRTELGVWPQTNLARGLSSLDAAWIQEYMVGLRTFAPNQPLACDSSGNGSLSSLDAVHIQEWKVGLRTRLPVSQACDSDWAFVPMPGPQGNPMFTVPPSTGPCTHGATVYDPLLVSAAGQDFEALLFGDCTGNWTPAPGGGAAAIEALNASAEDDDAPHGPVASLESPPACDGPCVALVPGSADMSGCAATELTIGANHLAGVLGVDLALALPPGIDVEAVRRGELTAGGQDCSLLWNAAGGALRVSLACVKPIEGGGALLAFTVRGTADGEGALEFARCAFNEGDPVCRSRGARISVVDCGPR